MYDIIAQQSTNKSYIHEYNYPLCGRMDSIALQLKALRSRTVPKISSRDVASLLDIPASTYAAYEDPKKYKKPLLPVPLTRSLCDIFSERGIPKIEILSLAGITGEFSSAALNPADLDEWVEVTGSVAAGVWKEQSDWPPSERYHVKFGVNRFPDGERFGLRVEGLSMNRTLPPGIDLECLRVIFSRYEPKPGDYVIVQRSNHGFTELTCKRLDLENDEWILRCESYEPDFQEVIRIGKLGDNIITDDEICIVAIVVGAKLDLAQSGLSERRFKYTS